MDKSSGHICFAQSQSIPDFVETFEFFERKGEIYRAKISDAIMPDGFRTGRFEAKTEIFNKYKETVLSGYSKVF